jgi:hypothetical protein
VIVKKSLIFGMLSSIAALAYSQDRNGLSAQKYVLQSATFHPTQFIDTTQPTDYSEELPAVLPTSKRAAFTFWI